MTPLLVLPTSSCQMLSRYSQSAIPVGVEVSGTRAQRSVLFDAGAQSPKETWLRLLLIQAGLPRPQTQIPVRDEFGEAIAYLDMGWEDMKVAVEYDGEQHRSDRRQYNLGHPTIGNVLNALAGSSSGWSPGTGRPRSYAAFGPHWLGERHA